MTARPRIDEQPVTVHPRSGAIHYEPLPADIDRPLSRLARLIRTAPDVQELDWLLEQRAQVMGDCPDCPHVRNAGDPPERRRRRSEMKYRTFQRGPRNKSGKAKS